MNQKEFNSFLNSLLFKIIFFCSIISSSGQLKISSSMPSNLLVIPQFSKLFKILLNPIYRFSFALLLNK